MTDRTKRGVKIVVAVLAVLIGLPVCAVIMLVLSFSVLPAIEHRLTARDFDADAWARPEPRSERYDMIFDVEDFLDERPTRDEVSGRLGHPDFDYICDGVCWDLGSPTGFQAYWLDVSFDASGRVESHSIGAH